MIIKAMIERENFYELLENTLKSFYKNVFNLIVDVKINSKKSDILIFENLGSIHHRHADIKILKYWLNEYNIKNKPFKNLLAKIYVLFSFIFKDLFCQKYLHLSSNSQFHNSIAIFPSNRKIRIFDFKEHIVYAIIKDGFTRKYFQNEVCYRIESKYDFVPKILDHGENWYSEMILHGQPLARVKNNRMYNDSILQANLYLQTISKDTKKEVKTFFYLNELTERLKNKLLLARTIKKILYYKEMQIFIDKLFSITTKEKYSFKLVLSHGDLQSGNIWFNKEFIKIIDWETHSFRSEWYDFTVLNYSIRRKNKLKELFELIKHHNVFFNIVNQQYALAVVCLEDIEFYLDDLLELPRNYGNKIFDRISLEFLNMGY